MSFRNWDLNDLDRLKADITTYAIDTTRGRIEAATTKDGNGRPQKVFKMVLDAPLFDIRLLGGGVIFELTRTKQCQIEGEFLHNLKLVQMAERRTARMGMTGSRGLSTFQVVSTPLSDAEIFAYRLMLKAREATSKAAGEQAKADEKAKQDRTFNAAAAQLRKTYNPASIEAPNAQLPRKQGAQ